MATVLAKLRPLSDQPKWATCCEEMRNKHREQTGKVLRVIPFPVIIGEATCPFCGRIADEVKYVRTTRKGVVIAVECYEFDEKFVEAS